MRLTVATLIAVLYVAATRAGPLSSDNVDLVSGTFPIVDLSSVKGDPNITLSSEGVKPDVVDADTPASLLLCKDSGCINCQAIDLTTVPNRQCFSVGSSYRSAIISQLDNSGLSYGVYVAPTGCDPVYKVPLVNTCYNPGVLFNSYIRT